MTLAPHIETFSVLIKSWRETAAEANRRYRNGEGEQFRGAGWALEDAANELEELRKRQKEKREAKDDGGIVSERSEGRGELHPDPPQSK